MSPPRDARASTDQRGQITVERDMGNDFYLFVPTGEGLKNPGPSYPPAWAWQLAYEEHG